MSREDYQGLDQETKNLHLIAEASQGHIEIVKQLIEAGANVNAVDGNNNTALIMAAYSGHKEIVEKLIEAEADVNAVNKDGNTALIAAAQGGHKEIVELLLNKGASVDNPKALFIAYRGDNIQIVKTLIKSNEIGAKDILFYAVQDKKLEMLKAILEAKPDLKEEKGLADMTIFLYSIYHHLGLFQQDKAKASEEPKDNSALKQIIEHLINIGVDVNTQDNNGNTALLLAASKGSQELVEKLIAAGADVNAVEKNGNSALNFAAQVGHLEIVELLLEKGANVNLKNTEGYTVFDIRKRNT